MNVSAFLDQLVATNPGASNGATMSESTGSGRIHAAAFPDQLVVTSLQLLPGGFNMSAFFPIDSAAGGSDASGGSDSSGWSDESNTTRAGTSNTASPPPASSGALLLRIRHIYQAGLDLPTLASPASVDLVSCSAFLYGLDSLEDAIWIPRLPSVHSALGDRVHG
jgi:hypothetical protein